MVFIRPADGEGPHSESAKEAFSPTAQIYNCENCGWEVRGQTGILRHKGLCGVKAMSTDEEENA